jgi:hypothetical protein
MSLSAGAKSSKSTTNSSSQGDSDPWDYSVPYLQDFLKEVGAVGGVGLTPDQKTSFEYLKNNALQGNPWDVEQAKLTNDMYATPDRAAGVGAAYTTLQGQLGDYASGKYADPMQNPQIMAMMTQVGDDIANRTNAMFAGAGRDLSGANQQATAKGVSQGTLGLLLDQYNKGQAQQFDAAKTLYGAGADTSTTQAGLDAQRNAIRGGAADAGARALDMQNQGANQILELDQQIKTLPYEDLATVGSLLFPVAGLGQQQSQQGTSTTKGKSTSVGMGVNLLSDERAKTDIQEIGEMADGQTMYRYRYKDDPTGTIHVGPMAQEVEQEHPEAVREDGNSGLLTVNMDAATRKAADIVRKRMAAKGGK